MIYIFSKQLGNHLLKVYQLNFKNFDKKGFLSKITRLKSLKGRHCLFEVYRKGEWSNNKRSY